MGQRSKAFTYLCTYIKWCINYNLQNGLIRIIFNLHKGGSAGPWWTWSTKTSLRDHGLYTSSSISLFSCISGDLLLGARLLGEACQWSVFSWIVCFACFANGIYIWFMSATICRQANQKYKRKKNARLSKPERILEVWENPWNLWKISCFLFFKSTFVCNEA